MTTPVLPDATRELLEDGGGHVLAHQLPLLGATRRDLERWRRHGLLERVTRGVYAAPPPADTTRADRYRRLVLAVLATHPGAGLVPAGPAAIVLHGLPLLGAPPRVVHVAGPRRGGAKPGELVRPLGELPSAQVVVRDGRAIAGPARAALDTARLMGTLAGVAAADAALRAGSTTLDELASVCAGLAGRTGVAHARRAAQLASPLSESPGESWSAEVLDRHGLPTPVRQHVVHDADGLVGRVDFWWPGVAGEFDGRVKYGRRNPSGRAPEDVLWQEKRREDRLRAAGIRVVRWTAEDLARPGPWLRRLRDALA